MSKKTPRLRFSGGPLDGQVREKREPGRWNSYRDEDGAPVPTEKIEKYRAEAGPCACRPFRLYQLGDSYPYEDEEIMTEYVWSGDDHVVANHPELTR